MTNAWIASLHHCTTNLTRFSGRDRRGQFWPYAGTVVAGVFLVWGVSFSIVVGRLQNQFMAQAGASAGNGTNQDFAQVNGEFESVFNTLGLVMNAIVVVTITLLAAAVTRRLHDGGRVGWWGLLPLPFLLAGFAGMTYFQSQMGSNRAPPMGLFMAMFFNNFIYIVCLVVLIVMLASRSDPADNRYGPIATDS